MQEKQSTQKKKWFVRIIAGILSFCLFSMVFLSDFTRISISPAAAADDPGASALDYLIDNTDYLSQGWFQRQLKAAASFIAPKSTYEKSSMYADVHIGRGEYDLAIPFLQRCLELVPRQEVKTLAVLNMKLGCLFSLTGNLTGAASTLEKSLQQNQAQEDVHYVLAEVYTGMNRLTDAALHLKHYLAGRNNPALLESLGDLYAAQNDYQQAADTFRQITINGAQPGSARFKLGVSNMGLGRYEEALTDFSACISSGDEVAASLYYRGAAYLRLSDFVEAQTNFTACMLLDMDSEIITDLHFKRGVSLMAQSSYEAAVQDFSLSITLGEAVEESLLNRGICNYEMGKDSAALADFNLSLVAGADQFRVADMRALVYMRMEDYLMALADFDLLAQTDNLLPHVLLSRGFCYMKTQQYDLAIADFTDCIDQEADNKQALYFRSACYQAKGNQEIAMADLAKAVE